MCFKQSLLNNYLTKLYDLTIYVTYRDLNICEKDVTKLQSVLGLIFDLVFFRKYFDQELNPAALPMITSTDAVCSTVLKEKDIA